MEEFLTVATKSFPPYSVYCGTNAGGTLSRIWQNRWKRVAIIGDEITLSLFGPQLTEALSPKVDRMVSVSFPPGEGSKNRQTKRILEDALLEAGLDRQSCIVAVGGGIALDVAGFVAATYLRGIDHINVATSLLAQVDAAVGGKTGLNTPAGKNLIGAFHHPRAVLLDTRALNSLPVAELCNGLAEAVKHAAIADRQLFTEIEAWAAASDRVHPPPDSLIKRCVAIKAEVVAADEGERGRRQVLNFGHTVAHALESATDHALSHGQAVAIGMVAELRLAKKLRGFPNEDLQRLETLLKRLGLPTSTDVPFGKVESLFSSDKKTRDQRIHCSLPGRLGQIDAQDGNWATATELDDLEEVWHSIRE